MDEPILFNPDNRLLGSAIGDLGMYGGQSHERFSVHEARNDAATDPIPTAGATLETAPKTIALTADAKPLPAGSALPAQAESGSGSPVTQSFLIATAVPDLAPAQPIGSAESVGLVQSVAVPAAQGSGAPPRVTDSAGEASAPVTETAAATATATANATDVVEAPILGTAASLIDHLADGPPAVAPAVPVAGAVTGPIVELVEGVTAPVTEIVGGVLTGAAGLVDDALEGLAGSDPLAGVQTLVSMVSHSDTFDLAPIVAPLLETVSDTGLQIVDALVGEDSLVETLLGAGHHDGGLLGLDHHDNPLGL